MTEQQISSISEFLIHAGTDYRVFDMGRSIRSVGSQHFLDMENGRVIADFPRLQHAWFGLVFWDKTRSEQYFIWFVKLPVDEQGKIVSATRNHFLQIIVEALGAQLEQAEEKNGQLPDNPYTFTPNQQQLADFNSISRKTLNLAMSRHYTAAKAYLASPMVIDWQQVALQGLSDYVAQIDDPTHVNLLQQHWRHYPQAVQYSLLTAMENQAIEKPIVGLIEQWLSDEATPAEHWQMGLRALCQSPATAEVSALLRRLLTSQWRHDHNILTVIAGRLWQHLDDESLLREYFDAVAQADPQHRLFKGVFTDLVQQPGLRQQCLAMLRWTDKSLELTQAVGSLFSQASQQLTASSACN